MKGKSEGSNPSVPIRKRIKDILKILGGKDGKILWNRRFSR